MLSERKDGLSGLPVEVLLIIMGYLSDDENKSIMPLLSKHFHSISSRYFLDNLYGRSLGFMEWQKNVFLTEMRNNISRFKKDHEVTLINRPDVTQAIARSELVEKLISLSVFVISVSMLCYKVLKFDAHQLDGLTIMTSIGNIFLGFVLFRIVQRNFAFRNNQFIGAPISQLHIDAIDAFYSKNNLLTNKPSLQPNTITVSQLLALVDVSLNETNKLAKLLSEYLLEKRFSANKTLDENDLTQLDQRHPALKQYSLGAISLWSSSKGKPSIISDEIKFLKLKKD